MFLITTLLHHDHQQQLLKKLFISGLMIASISGFSQFERSNGWTISIFAQTNIKEDLRWAYISRTFVERCFNLEGEEAYFAHDG